MCTKPTDVRIGKKFRLIDEKRARDFEGTVMLECVDAGNGDKAGVFVRIFKDGTKAKQRWVFHWDQVKQAG
jgi:hypothetical protein